MGARYDGDNQLIQPVYLVGSDSTGKGLPFDSSSVAMSTTFTWSGSLPATRVDVVVVTQGTYTRTITYTNDGTNLLTSTRSSWVKS